MKNTVTTLRKQKEEGSKISMLTCYDYTTACLVEQAGVNAVLIGDSLGMTMLGYDDTLPVTMEDMVKSVIAEYEKIGQVASFLDLGGYSYLVH